MADTTRSIIPNVNGKLRLFLLSMVADRLISPTGVIHFGL